MCIRYTDLDFTFFMVSLKAYYCIFKLRQTAFHYLFNLKKNWGIFNLISGLLNINWTKPRSYETRWLPKLVSYWMFPFFTASLHRPQGNFTETEPPKTIWKLHAHRKPVTVILRKLVFKTLITKQIKGTDDMPMGPRKLNRHDCIYPFTCVSATLEPTNKR